MSGIGAAVAVAGAKESGKALLKFLGRELSTDEWRLAGRYEAEPKGGGLYLARIDPADPLRLEHLPTGQKLVVPFREMETDFASVPRILQSLAGGSSVLHLQPTSYKDAALFHDELYAAAWAWAVKGGRAVKVPISKRQADAVLFVGMECSGATVADGLSYHGAVALFGGDAWRTCRRETPAWPVLFEDFEDGGAA